MLREGSDILLVGFGPIVDAGHGRPPTRSPPRAGRSASINARFAKPLDRQLILEQARGKRLVVTLEESVVDRRLRRGVLELLEEARLVDPACREVVARIIGIPADHFVDHGSVADLRRLLRLDAAGIAAQVRETLATLALRPARAGAAHGRQPGSTSGGPPGAAARLSRR